MIDRASIFVIILTALLSYLLFLIVELTSPSETFLSISRQSWHAIVGSILAASLFLCIHSLIGLLRTARTDVHSTFYKNIAEDFGLLSIFAQRGQDDAQAIYATLLKGAHNRVWAFGITNKHFLQQHSSTLVDLMRHRQIDIVISFWDPLATLSVSTPDQTSTEGIIQLQHRLEGAGPYSADWDGHVQRCIDKIAGDLAQLSKPTGRLRVFAVAHAANFTSLVIDDHVFFFPFLVGPDSTNDPMLHVTADRGLGKRIVRHYETVIAAQSVARILFDSEH